MKSKMKNQQADYIKANRRGSRDAEIANFGHPVNYHRIQISKKVYNRKKSKADDTRHLPFLFLRIA